jgi:hypothetical protein
MSFWRRWSFWLRAREQEQADIEQAKATWRGERREAEDCALCPECTLEVLPPNGQGYYFRTCSKHSKVNP